jgi:hypothetical protein
VTHAQIARGLRIGRLLLCSTDDPKVRAFWRTCGFELTEPQHVRAWDLRHGDLIYMTNTVQMHKALGPPRTFRPVLLRHGAFRARLHVPRDAPRGVGLARVRDAEAAALRRAAGRSASCKSLPRALSTCAALSDPAASRSTSATPEGAPVSTPAKAAPSAAAAAAAVSPAKQPPKKTPPKKTPPKKAPAPKRVAAAAKPARRLPLQQQQQRPPPPPPPLPRPRQCRNALRAPGPRAAEAGAVVLAGSAQTACDVACRLLNERMTVPCSVRPGCFLAVSFACVALGYAFCRLGMPSDCCKALLAPYWQMFELGMLLAA